MACLPPPTPPTNGSSVASGASECCCPGAGGGEVGSPAKEMLRGGAPAWVSPSRRYTKWDFQDLAWVAEAELNKFYLRNGRAH